MLDLVHQLALVVDDDEIPVLVTEARTWALFNRALTRTDPCHQALVGGRLVQVYSGQDQHDRQ